MKRGQARPTKRPRSTSKDIDKLLKIAWKAGWYMEKGGNDHIKVYAPGRQRPISAPLSPSKQRSVARLRSKLRTAGLKLPGE